MKSQNYKKERRKISSVMMIIEVPSKLTSLLLIHTTQQFVNDIDK